MSPRQLAPLLLAAEIASFVFAAPAGAQEDFVAVVPVPARATLYQGEMPIDAGFRVRIEGYRDARLVQAAERLVARLRARTGIRRFHGPESAVLEIRCRRDGESPESYELIVRPEGAELSAETTVGVLRGLETFLQHVHVTSRGFVVPSVVIEDSPRFPWRGLLIDVARHFQPVEVIERNLDAMAAVKLNVLHWHLTDDQGFRVESRRFPELHRSGSGGDYYSQDDVRHLVAYAHARGIRVVPEFDVPGHATSWLVGYPELGSAPGPYELETRFGIRDPTLDPTREDVYRFLDAFFGEMAELFPDRYVHIGGDEVNGRHWDESAAIQRFMEANAIPDNHALQARFNERVSRILARHGKRMIGWDEILHPDLPEGTVVQSWRGRSSLARAVTSGFEGILSFGYYLDHMWPSSFHAGIDPAAPIENVALDEHARARILGGEACMWGELVTPETIDSRIWPRAGAVAERLWSPPRGGESLYLRLDRLSAELDRMGLQHESGRLRMLRRLAGQHPVEPLQTLADVLEPVRFYARTRVRDYQTDTPLNRLVDAVAPESRRARSFSERELIDWLEAWKANHDAMKPLMRDSHLLKEVEPVSLQLSQLAAAGLEAIEFVRNHERPPALWIAEKRALLQAAPAPDFTAMEHMARYDSWPEAGTWWDNAKSLRKQAEVEIAIVPLIAELIESAARQ